MVWLVPAGAPQLPNRRARTRALLALALARTTDGIMTKLLLGLGAVMAIGMVVLGVIAGRSSAPPDLERVPVATTMVMAWGAGVLIAFSAAARSYYRDLDEGYFALAALRGASPSRFVMARVAALALVLFGIAACGALLAGAAAALAAHGGRAALYASRGLIPSFAYAAGFAVTVAPLSAAILGTRTRTGGYGLLFLLLILPALLSDWTAQLVPAPWAELLSIPGALDGLEASLSTASFDLLQAVRAIAMVAAFALLALAWVRVQAAALGSDRRASERRALQAARGVTP